MLIRPIIFTMKKTSIFLVILLFTVTILSAQTENIFKVPLIGDKAPSFTAKSTQGDISFPDDYFDKWILLFSHPADFTPVCTSEILDLASMQDDFKKLNTELMVVSTDRLNSHIEWVKSIESINYKERGLMKINFPIVSDSELEISKKYGMIHPGSSSTNTVRAVYIINPDDKIRAIFYYPKNIGRNLDEIKRTLIALQYSEKNEVLIPANWNPSDDVLISSPETMDEAEKLEKTNNPDLYSLTWYMWFMKQ